MSVFDMHPTLVTYLHSKGESTLDRCLVPEEWISSARWSPALRALPTNNNYDHKILAMKISVKPTSPNNPRDPKHDTILKRFFHMESLKRQIFKKIKKKNVLER